MAALKPCYQRTFRHEASLNLRRCFALGNNKIRSARLIWVIAQVDCGGRINPCIDTQDLARFVRLHLMNHEANHAYTANAHPTHSRMNGTSLSTIRIRPDAAPTGVVISPPSLAYASIFAGHFGTRLHRYAM